MRRGPERWVPDDAPANGSQHGLASNSDDCRLQYTLVLYASRLPCSKHAAAVIYGAVACSVGVDPECVRHLACEDRVPTGRGLILRWGGLNRDVWSAVHVYVRLIIDIRAPQVSAASSLLFSPS